MGRMGMLYALRALTPCDRLLKTFFRALDLRFCRFLAVWGLTGFDRLGYGDVVPRSTEAVRPVSVAHDPLKR